MVCRTLARSLASWDEVNMGGLNLRSEPIFSTWGWYHRPNLVSGTDPASGAEPRPHLSGHQGLNLVLQALSRHQGLNLTSEPIVFYMACHQLYDII